MAYPGHVALVQQGATAITAWREAHPGERLHLAGVDLAGANLRGANLHGARLSGATLDRADLVGADLQHADLRAASLAEADLTGARLQHASLVRAHLARAHLRWARLPRAHLHGAYLHQAHLQEANLQRAYLVGTDLSGADLRGAYLERADLQWANLQETILSGARLQEANLHESVVGATIFGHTHLHGARGLDTCRHQAPSRLDVGTCACSGSLLTDFLRGCGWSEAQLGSLAGQRREPPMSACIERSLALPIDLEHEALPVRGVDLGVRERRRDCARGGRLRGRHRLWREGCEPREGYEDGPGAHVATVSPGAISTPAGARGCRRAALDAA